MRAALCQARAEGRDRRINFRGPTIARLLGQERLAPDPGTDRRGIQATGGSTLAERMALGKARLDLRIAMQTGRVAGLLRPLEPRGPPLAGERPGRRGRLAWRRRGGRRWWRLTGQQTTEGGGEPWERAGEGCTPMAQPGKAIRHLDRVRRPCSRPSRLV